jgi:hypothetical protein
MTREPNKPPPPAFEDVTLRIAIADIVLLRKTKPNVRKSVKYGQIAASILEVGIIEPPVVVRDPDSPNRFRLLDGHIRLDILVTQGVHEVVCLIATEDEAFTYNNRISRLAIIQEHKMILNAVKRGASEEKIARALNVNIAHIRMKRNLLAGICPETAELLKEKHVPTHAFIELRKLKPMRQIRAAEMMIAMNRYSTSYVRSIVAATSESDFVEGKRPAVRGLTEAQIALMGQESAGLEREFKLIEKTYGPDHLDLVLAAAYVTNLLGNARVVRHLAQYHAELLNEFQNIADMQRAA